jgi:3-oxoacyl-[acyl-carrier-protein] synthase-3
VKVSASPARPSRRFSDSGPSVGITGLAYRLPPRELSIEQLEAGGRIASPAAVLRDFGFAHCHVHEEDAPFDDALIESGREALERAALPRDDVGLLLWISGLAEHAPPARPDTPLDLFRYPAARAHHELGLTRARALALSQQGCSGLLSAIDLAAASLRASDEPAALCLAGDALPHGACREIMYNVMSDAGAAVLLQRDAPGNTLVSFHQQTQSWYWDTPAREQEIFAAYFPVAQRVITAALEKAGLRIADVAWFVPHNVSLRSWQILARLLGLPEEKVWTRNIARVGHTVSCDHVINLADMEREGALHPGDYLVLFTFGLGASWSCMVLRH